MLMPRFLLTVALLTLPVPALSEDSVYTIEFKDGGFSPARLEVPLAPTVTIRILNAGTTPVEFESKALHPEKVLKAGADMAVVLTGATAGEYEFFDDFHPDAGKGVIALVR
jgi:hypothetical protein